MKQLLWYGDAPTAATGFGTVSRNVLKAIHDTGDWAITVLGVNYFGTIHDYPYTILPAGSQDGEPFGKKAFLRCASAKTWDLIIINNDTYVVNDLAGDLKRALENKPTKTIFYYAVDSKVPANMTAMIEAVDMPVAYSRFGREETAKVLPHREVAVIPHGCDEVPRITAAERHEYRRQAFGIVSDETFLWINVNRNSIRKEIARTIEAFAKFHDFQPDSKLYVHCQQIDNGLDMGAAAAEAGVLESVAFPAECALTNGGMPRDMLMRVYQLADGFVTTHLGEGWGLTVTEAMACGVPVVAPFNSTMPEILGMDYPYLYPCEETAWVDNAAFRQRGTVRQVFSAMRALHDLRNSDHGVGLHARAMASCEAFVRENSWKNVGAMWLLLIDALLQAPRAIAPISETL